MKYTIKAGRHYANKMLLQRIMWGNELQFRFRIHNSAMYNPAGLLNGWSKIFGIAEPLGHTNSCRLVYMCDNTGLKIGMYCYVNGVSPQEDTKLKMELCNIVPEVDYFCTIKRGTKHYCVKIEILIDAEYQVIAWDIIKARERGFPLRFLLHPYLGGRFTFNHDAHITVTRLKTND